MLRRPAAPDERRDRRRRGRRRRRRRHRDAAPACAACVDRLAALDGTLEVQSPAGGGTRLRALIPCTAADVIVERRRRAGDAMKRLLALRAARARVAGCGKVTEVREPDVFARRGHQARAAADDRARRAARAASGSRSSRHGQASSTFWAIVRNGVDAAARQMDVVGLLPRARRFYGRPHARADRRGGRQQARRPRRLDPRPGARPGDPARGARRHPGRLDQLGLRTCGASSAIARPRRPARGARRAAAPASGSRAAGVRNALCVNQEVGNKALDARCAGVRAGDAPPRRALAACSRSTSRTATRPRRKLAAAIEQRKADGVLALNSGGAQAALDAKKLGGRATQRQARHVRPLSPRCCEAMQGRADRCSRSTSRPTSRATCRS